MKKATTFFDKTLHEQLAKNPEWSAAFRAAMAFGAQVMAYGVEPRILGGVTPISHCQLGFNKFTCGCHTESDDLKAAFEQANRVEVCLTLRASFSLMIGFSFYRRGAKTEFAEFFFYFEKSGLPGDVSYFKNIDKVGPNDYHVTLARRLDASNERHDHG